MTNGVALAAQAVASFEAWVAERDRAGDWPSYVRGRKLNRSEVAKECGFGRAAWGQNPGLAAALEAVEARLAGAGVLVPELAVGASLDPQARAEVGAAEESVRRAMSARAVLEKRVKALEEQNAVLRAENRALADRLRRSVLADEHLGQTGRLLPQ